MHASHDHIIEIPIISSLTTERDGEHDIVMVSTPKIATCALKYGIFCNYEINIASFMSITYFSGWKVAILLAHHLAWEQSSKPRLVWHGIFGGKNLALHPMWLSDHGKIRIVGCKKVQHWWWQAKGRQFCYVQKKADLFRCWMRCQPQYKQTNQLIEYCCTPETTILMAYVTGLEWIQRLFWKYCNN